MKTKLKALYKFLIRWTIRSLVIAALCGAAFYYGFIGRLVEEALAKWGPEPRIITEWKDKLVPVEMSLEEALRLIPPKYGVPPEVVEVLLIKESGSKHGRMDALRHESHHYNRKDVIRYSKGNADLRRIYSSSVGALQIMAWHAPPRGLRWDELLQPRQHVEVGMSIWAKCYSKYEGRPGYHRFKAAATCYNGSGKYGQDFVNKLSVLVLNNMADEMEPKQNHSPDIEKMAPTPRKPAMRIENL